MRLSVVIPALNEAQTVRTTLLPQFTRVPRMCILRTTSSKASSVIATPRQPQEYPELGTLLAALVATPSVRRLCSMGTGATRR